MTQFGLSNLKPFMHVDGIKVQEIRWNIDENISLSAQYKLINHAGISNSIRSLILFRSLPVKKFDEISGKIWLCLDKCVLSH